MAESPAQCSLPARPQATPHPDKSRPARRVAPCRPLNRTPVGGKRE
nr:hypothetical protein [Kosakonia radicincitans]